MFKGHGEGCIHVADDGDGLIFGGDSFGLVTDDGDDEIRVTPMGSPEPVVVLAAEDGREVAVLVAAKDIEGTGFAIVVGEEDDAGAIFGRQRVVGAGDDLEVLLPAKAIGIELREGAGANGFGVAGFVTEMESGGVAKPGLRSEDGNRHGEEKQAGEEECGLVEGESDEAVGTDLRGGGGELAEGTPATLLPGEGSGRKEDGVDGGDVVGLGVEGEHADEEEDEGETDPAPGRAAEQPDETGHPKEEGDGVESLDLGVEEGERAKHGVLTTAIILKEFEGGPVIVDLPKEIRRGDGEKQGDAGEGFAAEEEGAAGAGDEESEAEGDEEEGH